MRTTWSSTVTAALLLAVPLALAGGDTLTMAKNRKAILPIVSSADATPAEKTAV